MYGVIIVHVSSIPWIGLDVCVMSSFRMAHISAGLWPCARQCAFQSMTCGCGVVMPTPQTMDTSGTFQDIHRTRVFKIQSTNKQRPWCTAEPLEIALAFNTLHSQFLNCIGIALELLWLASTIFRYSVQYMDWQFKFKHSSEIYHIH